MSTEVRRGKVDSGEHDLDPDDDTCDLEREVVEGVLVVVDPDPWTDPVQGERAGDYRFTKGSAFNFEIVASR